MQIYIPSIAETAKIGENSEEEIKYIREDAGEGIILTAASEESQFRKIANITRCGRKHSKKNNRI